jgi:hypothetical protein
VGMSTTVFLRIRETQEFGLQGDIYKGLWGHTGMGCFIMLDAHYIVMYQWSIQTRLCILCSMPNVIMTGNYPLLKQNFQWVWVVATKLNCCLMHFDPSVSTHLLTSIGFTSRSNNHH